MVSDSARTRHTWGVLTLGIFGTGRLGTAIRDAAAPRDDVTVSWAVGRDEAPSAAVDIAVEVSLGAAVPDRLGWARATGTPLVIGTTGWDRALLEDYPAELSVLIAPNFSLGVALVRRLAGVLGGYAASAPVTTDLAVSETHHRHKVDAPSGTALVLADALAAGAGRPVEAVQTPSLRLGSVIGDHEVVVASALETITLRHSAHDRALYATGALSAAHWLATRPTPGIFTLDDLAEDHLRALLERPRTLEG